jgi:PAS domain S-box-containing protein
MTTDSKTVEQLREENEALKTKLAETQERVAFLEDEQTTAFIIGDAVADGICVVDPTGVVTRINRGYTEITGITEERILGKTIQEMVEQGEFTNAVSYEVIEKKQKISAMSTVKKGNKQVLLVGTPFLDEKGDLVKVITVMRNMTELVRLQEELKEAEKKKQHYKDQLNTLKNERIINNFVGKDPSIQRVKELIDYVAKTDATVLLTGETGSGKEVVAREIYKKSNRKDGPYVKVNCSAIPENLLESELFGYVKGAFTGADKKDKKGLFEIANNGTILLDEIGEMPMKLQTKLLRVLQEREITRVGGTESIKIDTRVIVSTNEELEKLIQQNLFRADLYYRLNVFPIKLPSLRERRGDIPDIAAAFLNKFNQLYGKNKSFDSSAIAALVKHDWPGNVRELENIVERMVIISANKVLTHEDVLSILYMGEKNPSEALGVDVRKVGLKEAVRIFEKEILEEILRECGNSYAAAEILKTTQPTIIRKAQSLGIPMRNKPSK